MADAGFEIKGRFYPFVESFRLGDPVLVERLTGLEWHEWIERLPDGDDPTADGDLSDPLVMLGMVGVAIWQGNPSWARDKVARYVERLNMEDVEATGDDQEDEFDPPPPAPATAPPSDSGSES